MWHLKEHTSAITTIAFNSDGTRFASAEQAGPALLWDLSGPPHSVPLELPGKEPTELVTSLTFLPGTIGLASVCTIDRTVEYGRFVVGARSLDAEWSRELSRNVRWQAATAVSSGQTELFVLGGSPQRYGGPQLWRWKIDDWTELTARRIGWYAGQPLIAMNDKLLCVSGTDTPYVSLSSLLSGNMLRSRKTHPTIVKAIAIRPGSDQLYTAGPNEVRVWNLPMLRRLRSIPRRGTQYITTMAISPDGRTVAVGRNAGLVNLLDADTDEELATFTWPVGNVRHLAFAPDGFRLAVAGERGSIVIWDLE